MIQAVFARPAPCCAAVVNQSINTFVSATSSSDLRTMIATRRSVPLTGTEKTDTVVSFVAAAVVSRINDFLCAR